MEHVNIENCFKEMSKGWGGQEKWLHVCSNVLVGESMMASTMGSVFQLTESVGVTKKRLMEGSSSQIGFSVSQLLM